MTLYSNVIYSRSKGLIRPTRSRYVLGMDVREISRVMARQNGVINRDQAIRAGASPGFIRTRLENADWLELSHGVYANSSSPPTWERRLRAAVLGHPRAYVGGRSAAYLHGFDGVRPSRPEVLIPYGGNNRSQLARVIRARHFDEVTTDVIRGFVVTSVAETILTMSLTLRPSSIEKYVDDRLASRRLAIPQFDPILARLEFARQPGLGSLRRIVGQRADDAYQPPTTELERLLYRLLDRPELPPYERQLPIKYRSTDATVDAYIPVWKLVVEGDGRRFHSRQADHDRDRLRDAEALAAGHVVLRLTWKMLKYQPEKCLQRLLAIGKHRSRPRA